MNRSIVSVSAAASGYRPMGDATVPWRSGIIATVGLWLFVLMLFLPVIIDRHTDNWRSIALDSSTVLVSMVLAMPLLAVMRGTLRWSGIARLGILALCVVAIAIVQTAFDLAFTLWVANNLADSWHSIPRDLARAHSAAFNYIAVFSVNLALFQIIYANRRSRLQDREFSALQSTAQRAQIMALQFRVNPHFLFNTLNALSAMIVAGRNDEAEKLVEQLSGFLRASAAFDPETTIPLDEELTIAEQYLDIEQVRFGGRLKIDVTCSREAGACEVPPGILQPLLSQAIEAGVSRSRDTLAISVDGRLDDNILRVLVRAELPGDAGFEMNEDLELLVTRLRTFDPRAMLSIEKDGVYAMAMILLHGSNA